MGHYYKNCLLLFIICSFLASCGGDNNKVIATSQNQIGSLTVSKSAAGTLIPTTSQQYDVIRLMLAMFNAAPGNMYLQEFAGYIANGTTMSELANMLAQTEAFQSPQLYPSSLTSQQFAAKLVANLMADTANSVNRAWLTDVIISYLDNGASRGEVIWLLVSALTPIPYTDYNWGKTSAQFANKVDVAYYYSVTTGQSSTDLGTLQAVTRSVTDDPATVITAKALKPVNLALSWASVGITGGSRQTVLTWSKPSTTKTTTSTTSTYNIYWSTKPGVTKQNGNKIANATSPYSHWGLVNGTTCYYVVTEVTSGLEGPESLEVGATPKALLPQAPIGITPYPQNRAVKLSLDRTGATTATKYNLYWSTSPNLTNYFKITNAFGTGTTFLHQGLTNGVMYYYAVTAVTQEGESPKSKIVAAVPLADINAVNYLQGIRSAQIAAPKAVTAIATSQQVTISWEMPASQIPTVFDPDSTPTQSPVISAYNIYWSTTLITDKQQAHKLTVPAPAMSFIHNTGLTNNSPYYYLVTAVAGADTNGNPLKTADGKTLTFESPASSQVLVVPEVSVPIAPTALAATSGTQQITLNWTPSTTKGALYRLYASNTIPAKPEDLVNQANLVAITATSSYIHTGLQYGTTYYYVVTAVTDGESPPTNIVIIVLR